MSASRRDASHDFAEKTGAVDDTDGDRAAAVRGAVIAQLAVGVSTPGFDLPIGQQSQAVIFASRDCHHTREVRNGYW